MEQKVVSLRLWDGIKELSAKIKKLNEEGWRVDSVSVENFEERSENFCFTRIAYLLCTKIGR